MGARQQEKSNLTRSELFDAMVPLFLKKGYDQTTIKDIADNAGYSVGSFYRHWKSKGQAFAEFWDNYVASYIRGSVENAPDGSAKAMIDHLIQRSEQFADNEITLKLYNTYTALITQFEFEGIAEWSERFTMMLYDFVKSNTSCTDERKLMSATLIVNTIMNTHAMQHATSMLVGYDIDKDTLATSIAAILRSLDSPSPGA